MGDKLTAEQVVAELRRLADVASEKAAWAYGGRDGGQSDAYEWAADLVEKNLVGGEAGE